MSALFKLFGKGKSSKKTKDKNKAAAKEEEHQLPPEIAAEVCSGKSKFSISHSGRFKAKRRDRITLNEQFYAEKEAAAAASASRSQAAAATRPQPRDTDSRETSGKVPGGWMRPAQKGTASKATAL